MSQLVEDFARLFNLPDVMLPYVDFVASEPEMRLVLAMDARVLSMDEIVGLTGLPSPSGEDLFRQCYSRGIIRRTTRKPPFTYKASTFYHRISPIAQYERWKDIPNDVRQQVIDWELAEWVKLWAPTVADFDANPHAYLRMPNHDFLLLHEALEMVDAADAHAVVVCDCRAITEGCKQPAESCIRLGDGARMTLERGMGRRLTKEECHELVVHLDRRGLMHTGDWSWKERGGVFGFCNCCTCDCFPSRGGLAFGLRTRFPRAHYFAARDESKCEHCGVCVKRCYYGCYEHDGTMVTVKGKQRRHVTFDPDKCWGCGLCSTGCTRDAITMVPVQNDLSILFPPPPVGSDFH